MLIQGTLRSSSDSSPIAGAIISSSLDSQTAISDGNGQFTLAPRVTGDISDIPYALIVNTPGFETYSETRFWGNQPLPELLFLDPAPDPGAPQL